MNSITIKGWLWWVVGPQWRKGSDNPLLSLGFQISLLRGFRIIIHIGHCSNVPATLFPCYLIHNVVVIIGHNNEWHFLFLFFFFLWVKKDISNPNDDVSTAVHNFSSPFDLSHCVGLHINVITKTCKKKKCESVSVHFLFDFVRLNNYHSQFFSSCSHP